MNKFRGISEELLSDGYKVRIKTIGSSMFPFISTGDRITIRPEKAPKIGEIVVFKRRGEIVCHRLAKVFEKDDIRYYQTRGDNHFRLDEAVTSDQILGKVIKIERRNVSRRRRALLVIFPILRFLQINALVISALRHFLCRSLNPESSRESGILPERFRTSRNDGQQDFHLFNCRSNKKGVEGESRIL